MVQQINYIVAWKAIRDAAYQSAMIHWTNPSYAFVSTYNELDTILFLIREFDGVEQQALFNIPRVLLLQCSITLVLILVS